jgi:hypothetical protein
MIELGPNDRPGRLFLVKIEGEWTVGITADLHLVPGKDSFYQSLGYEDNCQVDEVSLHLKITDVEGKIFIQF